ncbi:hypothetical protein [Lactiplantibacillus plantarum]|uniref:hypothetical protein n=1 Tax=Lactiplantibacillus plantarum TaxID=1590 RepID=UPI003F531B19
MNNEIFKYYIKEINLLSNFVKIAANEFNKVIQDQSQDSNIIWYDLQNIIVYASDISKVIWGSNRPDRKARVGLQKILNVEDNWEIGPKNKTLRNHLEHIDENLVSFSNSPKLVVIDRLITSDESHSIMIGDKSFIPSNEQTLRCYNLTTKRYILFGHSFNIGKACAEIKSLREKTEELIESEATYENLVSRYH